MCLLFQVSFFETPIGMRNHVDTSVVFFICLRETLETSIIVSVLLSFLKQTLGREQDAVTHKRLVRQVSWPGYHH